MKRILLLSDMHVFSYWGLIHPRFSTYDPKTGDTIKYRLNRTNVALWEHIMALKKHVQKYRPDIVIFNGDLCDGLQKRGYGKGIHSSVLSDQRDCCIQIIEDVLGLKPDETPDIPLYFTQGTDYHEMADGSPIEEDIAKYFYGKRETHKYFGDDLLIDECGVRLHVGHPIPVSNTSWQYRTTPLARDLLLLALGNAEDKYGNVDIAVRSHAHYFTAAFFPSQMGVITPAWQTRTPYAVRKDLITPPDIGWIELLVENPKAICIDRNGIKHIGRPCKLVGRESDSVRR